MYLFLFMKKEYGQVQSIMCLHTAAVVGSLLLMKPASAGNIEPFFPLQFN